MRRQYKLQPIVATDWPPRVGQDFFGRLALVEKQDNTQQGKSAWYQLRGQVDEIVEMSEDKAISIKDILKPEDSSESLRVVVIDGPPGIGKTTLCHKLLNMWSNGTLHQQYDLVLYCPLRNSKIATATTLTDLFVYKSPKVSKVVEWFSDREGKGLLIIFDGWDELSTKHRQSSLVANIICREQLDQCAVIVTSRSYASSSLLEMTTIISKHVQVIGFSEDEISTVIIQTLQKDQKLAQELITENKDEDGDYKQHFTTIQSSRDSQLAVKLINDLEVRGDVRSLCYIPLVSSMVILVYCKEKQLPTTLTQLYENFILQTIRRHVKRHDANPRTLGSLSSLPSQLADAFQEMCQIAYTNLTNKRITFSSHELHQLSLSEAVKEDYLGLITAFTDYDEEKYQFLHLSIQEFLAAWWIAKHEEKTEEVFKTHFDDDHFRMCLRFVAGLTHFEHESYQQYFNKQQLDLQCKREPLFGFKVCHVSSFLLNPDVTAEHHDPLSDDLEKIPFLLQLLYESQNTTLCQVLSQSINNHSLCLEKVRSLFDWLCLSYFIKNSNTTWKEIDLYIPYFDEKQILSVFSTGLTNSSAQAQCERLILYKSSDVLIKQLLQPSSLLHNIQECYCKLSKIQCISGLVLLQFLNLPKIKVLHLIIDRLITDIPIVGGTHYPDMCNELQESIKLNSTIQEMNIIVYKNEEQLITDTITFIMRGVTGNKTLTSLSLTAKAWFLQDDVPPPPTIPDGVIEQLLKDNKTLQALSLDICDELLPSSLNIVEVNTPLTALEIAGERRLCIELTTSLLTHISGLKCLILRDKYLLLLPYLILRSHPSLETLRLPLETIGSTIELFTVLQTNTTLKALKGELCVAYAEDEEDLIALLGDALKSMLAMNKTLVYLDFNIREYWIRRRVITTLLPYLMRGIEHNSTLQQLHVYISLPNNEAMKALFDIISQKKNLTEFKVNFILDESQWESSDEKEESREEEKKSSHEEKESSDEKEESNDEEKESSDEEKKMKKCIDEMEKLRDEEEQRMTVLFYEEVLPAVTNMLQSHTTIKLLRLKLEHYLSDKKLVQNESEIIQHFFETIFVHPTLEYINIERSHLSKMLDDQKESLIKKHKQEQPHRPLPIIDV